MTNDNLRVGLYGRVSGDQQEKEDTIASQLEASRGGLPVTTWNAIPNFASWTTATADTSWLAQASSDSGIKPLLGPSIASTFSTLIDFTQICISSVDT